MWMSLLNKNIMDQLGTIQDQLVEGFLPFRTVNRAKLYMVCKTLPGPPGQYILEDVDCEYLLSAGQQRIRVNVNKKLLKSKIEKNVMIGE